MKHKWLHFRADKETLFALSCGLAMILLSVAMTWFGGEIASIILRDALMIVLLGFFTPLYYIVVVKRRSLSVLGLHKNRLAASLAVNVGAGVALLALFVGKSTEEIVFTSGSFYAAAYIFVAGIFEMVFIYGFLRYELERAFVNYDQFCAGQPDLDGWFDTYWENQLAHSGLAAHDIALWKERHKLDRECSVEQECEMLRACKFKAVKCVYSCQKFSVIVAIK